MAAKQNKDKNKILSSNMFPVVGVGASAGGLDAFKRLIRSISESSGMAYILVQHLEPSHESLLAELLQKVTRIPVQEITNNVHVEPDHIYIIPSNKLLTATDGRLELSSRPPKNERNMPIDVFFTSLAEVHQAQAIGVVLSGTATDGTLGLKAIKDHGGITFAQEQRSAAFGGMPQSAIDADVVDFILPPEEIPMQLAKLTETFKSGLSVDPEDLQSKKEDAFRKVLSLLRVRRGTDFTYYKQTTIRRRIIRRMGLNKMDNLEDYVVYFRENMVEQDLLYQDLLIPVTGFFRDPATYDTISKSLLPLLLKEGDGFNPLRIWVAGCSTGEEPYSMAICLHEYLGDKMADSRIQVFATDISETAIAKARSGVYTKRDMTGVSPDRLEKYFTKANGSFHINRFIRDRCVFATHNFLKDPPFAKMDFVSCRNVLIYMESSLQRRALTTFHYALRENGYLLLGHSETTAPAADLFLPFGKHDKIFIRKNTPGKLLQTASDRSDSWPAGRTPSVRKEPDLDDFQKSADEMLLSRYMPPGVVVNEQLDIVQFRGSTGAWLEPSPGKPNLNLIRMAKDGLAFELRNALHKAKATNKTVIKENIVMLSMGKQQATTIEIVPLSNTAEPYFLILFRDSSLPAHLEKGLPGDRSAIAVEMERSAENLRVQQLEMELALLRDDMRSITQDQEAVNEELQSANEELLSGSEELQSLNEELETSKEEIQSTNEELTTLNQELFDRNEQLNLSRLYAESIVATIREPLVILDRNMLVRTANRAFYRKFGTSEEETEGRSFYGLGHGSWDMAPLRQALEKTICLDGKIVDLEVRYTFAGIGERVLLLNACEIFRKDNAEQLILLAIEDVTVAWRREDNLRVFSGELERKVEERTASLKESNALLKNSNENLEQFASIASHDLQEPLRKIRTFAALLNQRHSKDIDADAKELLLKISLSAERMSSLIRDVLDFSKVLEGNVFEMTDLNRILQHVIVDFDLLIAQKGASVRHDELPVINAVPLQMTQLFFNLISNALKFVKTEVAPMIYISSRMLDPGEVEKFPSLDTRIRYAEIVFTDNGIGISPQFSEQIFLIFQRLNDRKRFEGTGIGLALCRKIVTNHRGEIFMDSQNESGSRFHIILPVVG
jgi:two-component system, chemotaxis family, CheB/CheR fusion protein